MLSSEITQEAVAWDWRAEVRRWLNRHYRSLNHLGDEVVSFFELAFANTRCPDHAWFGVHSTRISLVVGNLFLAAIMAKSDEEQGIWLLLDQDPPPIDGFNYKPIIATRKSKFPLLWGHSESLPVISALMTNELLWRSYASASEKIRFCGYASDRDSLQKRRKKRRLSDFWLRSHPSGLFPDEVDEETPIIEGGKRQVTVNAYERDPRARTQCIEHYGTSCSVCGLSFGAQYGSVAEGFIHVHHLKPLSEIGSEYEVDPVEDLRPVCPNCHVVLHRRKPAFSIQEVIEFLRHTRTQRS